MKNGKKRRYLAIVFSLVMLLSTMQDLGTVKAETRKKAVTVSSRKKLAKLLRKNKNMTLRLVSEKKKNMGFKIPKKNFRKIGLQVDGNKVSVWNRGRFKYINIKKAHSFVERGGYNRIHVTGSVRKLAVHGMKNKLNIRTRRVGTLFVGGAGNSVKMNRKVTLRVRGEGTRVVCEQGAEGAKILCEKLEDLYLVNRSAGDVTVAEGGAEEIVKAGETMDGVKAKALREEREKKEKEEREKKEKDEKEKREKIEKENREKAERERLQRQWSGWIPGDTGRRQEQPIAKAFTERAISEHGKKVKLYPEPKNISLSDKEIKAARKVKIAVYGNYGEAVSKLLDEKFTNLKGITFEKFTVAQKDRENTKADLYVSLKTDLKKEFEKYAKEMALQNEQGYLIKHDGDRTLIIGADTEGLYYGLLSYAQLIEEGNSEGYFPKAEIADWPDIKLRGFVEGFYGYPWSFEGRKSIVRSGSTHKMNVYIYAPKDDPYHRDKWREDYPKKEAEEIKDLVMEAKKHNMDFCWSIHPGHKGFDYNSDKDKKAVIKKFKQLYDLGVRRFGICYDDLGYGDIQDGSLHADVINYVDNEFVKKTKGVKPIIVVGTRYTSAWGPGYYLEPLMKKLNQDVVVMWTGASTMGSINKTDFEWPKKHAKTDRNFAAWLNYPVNDYCDGKILMGPLECVYDDVDNLSGFFMNPMSFVEASKVSVLAGGDWSWNIKKFDKMKSWEKAISDVAPEEKEALHRFADNTCYLQKDHINFDESRYLKDAIDRFNNALGNHSDIEAPARELEKEFKTMMEDCAILEKTKNVVLKEEIKYHLAAYKLIAEAGVHAMNGMIEAKKGEIAKAAEEKGKVEANLALAKKITIKSFEGQGKEQDNIVEVGQKRILPLVTNALFQMKNMIESDLFSKELRMETNVDKHSGKVVAEGGGYTTKNLKIKLGKGKYMDIYLPKLSKISKVEINAADKLKLQYSINGVEWIDAETEAKGGMISTKKALGATAVRVVNEEKDLEIPVAEVKLHIVYSVGTVKAETSLGQYEKHVIDNIVDGKMSTRFYASGGSAEGSFVRIDLGKTIPLYDLETCFGKNPHNGQVDGFLSTKTEISVDGAKWEQVGGIIEAAAYEKKNIEGVETYTVSCNAGGKMARFIKISAGKAFENWAQIFEVFYNKKAGNLGDDKINLVVSECEIENGHYLSDEDLATAAKVQKLNGDNSLKMKITKKETKKLIVLQDNKTISNADVFVKTEGEWKAVGKLDKATCSFAVESHKNITDIKFVFKAGEPLPTIYEVIAVR